MKIAKLWTTVLAIPLLFGCDQHKPAEPKQAAAGCWRLYAANELSDDITVIDEPSHKVVGTVKVGKRPRGMAISGGKLYVADITKVRVVDLASGKLVASIAVPNSVFLNDMTSDQSGKVYVTDMLADTIYRIDGDKPELFLKDAMLASPNGVFADGDRLIVASWGKGIKPDFSTAEPGGLLSVDLASKVVSPLPGAQKFADLDGVVALRDSIYATAYMTGTLYRYHAGGAPEAVAHFKPGSADIGTDGKSILYVPLMNEGEVAALKLD